MSSLALSVQRCRSDTKKGEEFPSPLGRYAWLSVKAEWIGALDDGF